MKLKQLTIATLSTMLMLSGLTACGGSDNKTSTPSVGTATNPPVNNSLSELDQAKELIRTAKLFVTDADSVKKTYENASDLLTDQQQSRFGTALDVPGILHDYMRKHNLTTLTADQVKTLTARSDSDESLYAYLGQVMVEPSSDFKIQRNTDDSFSMSGTLKLTEDTYNWGSYANNYTKTLASSDIYTATFVNYVNTLDKVQNSATITGNFGFDSMTVGSGADAVVIKANPSAGQLSANFSKNVNYNHAFDMSDVHTAGIMLNKADASLKNIVMTANNNTVKATELSASALDISNQVNGKTIIRSIPYQFKIVGQLVMATPKTDATITLNASAKEADIKNILVIDGNEEVVEKSNMTLPMTALLAIKGQATGENNKTIPLDFQAKLSRHDNKVVTLDDLYATVEGKTLYALGKSNFDSNNELLNSEVSFKQNNAIVTVKFDKNNDAINTNGKIADILVNGKDYGDLMQNGSQITAKFTDNTLITL